MKLLLEVFCKYFKTNKYGIKKKIISCVKIMVTKNTNVITLYFINKLILLIYR